MIQDLISSLQAKHFRDLAAKGELVCPNCGMTANRIPDASGGALRCKTCGVTALLEEWSDAYRESLLAGDADQPPPGTKVIRINKDRIISWRIPASGGSCFVLSFGTIWTAFTALLSFGFLVGGSTVSSESGEISGIWLVPFFGVFWMIGLGLLYIELRSRYAHHLLTVGDGLITLRRELFGRTKEKSMPSKEIVSIAQKEFYQKNYKPVYGIEIQGVRRKIRFGTGLTSDEKSWLVADLRKTVKGDSMPQSILSPASGGAGHHRLSSFSFLLPVSLKHLLPSALILTVVGAAFASIGIWLIGGGPEENTFKIIWVGFSTLMAVAGISSFIKYLRSLNQEIRVEANETDVAIRIIKRGRIYHERSFPRSSVTGARAAGGKDYYQSMKQVALIVGEKSEKIPEWVDAEKADEFVKKVNAALGFSNG